MYNRLFVRADNYVPASGNRTGPRVYGLHVTSRRNPLARVECLPFDRANNVLMRAFDFSMALKFHIRASSMYRIGIALPSTENLPLDDLARFSSKQRTHAYLRNRRVRDS